MTSSLIVSSHLYPELRFGLSERTSSEGQIIETLSAEELKRLADNIRRSHPEAIAVSLLFSFANPQNELSASDELENLKLPLSVSHRILPEFREYERTSTVVVNAYLQPVMQHYLKRMEQRSNNRHSSARIFVMQSSGGITALTSAVREPV